ncbi:MAG: TetR/AcrR family transcriptional regulator [Tateyamaria sp.]
MADSKKNVQSERRSEIIAISTEMFLENGFSGTSMAQLAKACGIQKASFYHHFPSKDALFIACVNEGYAGAVQVLLDIRSDTSLSDREKIEKAVHSLYQSIVTSPTGRLSPLIAEVSRTMPAVADGFHKDYIIHQRAALRDIVSDGVARGSFKPQDFDIFHHLVFGPIVTLSLSREMFAQLDDLEAHFPVPKLEKGHLEIILRELGA